MKKIVVTGESKGVGKSIARKLLLQNFCVLGLSRTGASDLAEEFGEKYIHIPIDLSQPGKIKSVYKNFIRTHGSICGLVNNAAIAYDEIVTNADLDSLQHMFAVNVFSPIMLTRYIIRDMLLHETAGSIIHVSSICAHTGYKGLSMYAATKGALESFSKNTAREWGQRGIRSNCVAPGFMETEMSGALSCEQREKIFARTAMKKPVSIDSVASTIGFLLSEESVSITGEVITVDNGTL